MLPAVLDSAATIIPVVDETTDRGLDALRVEPEVEAGIVVATSGSTGTPKYVVLPTAALRAAADGFREQYGPFTWHCALPLHYVAGVMALVRGVLDEPHGGGFVLTRSDLTDLAPRTGPNAVCIVPTQLRRALADVRLTEILARFDLVVVGGAACPPELLADAARAGVRVLVSYGMSETCGGIAYDGRLLPGVEIDLGSGRVKVSTPARFAGYLGDRELTDQVLVDGWLVTNDRAEWVDTPQGPRLHVLGRLDEVVISGGVNVDLAQLQQVLDRISFGQLAVIAVPDPEWGQRVVLAAPDGTLEQWRDRLRPVLGGPALPRQLLIGELPRTASGKLDRAQLRHRALEGEASARETVWQDDSTSRDLRR